MFISNDEASVKCNDARDSPPVNWSIDVRKVPWHITLIRFCYPIPTSDKVNTFCLQGLPTDFVNRFCQQGLPTGFVPAIFS